VLRSADSRKKKCGSKFLIESLFYNVCVWQITTMLLNAPLSPEGRHTTPFKVKWTWRSRVFLKFRANKARTNNDQNTWTLNTIGLDLKQTWLLLSLSLSFSISLALSRSLSLPPGSLFLSGSAVGQHWLHFLLTPTTHLNFQTNFPEGFYLRSPSLTLLLVSQSQGSGCA